MLKKILILFFIGLILVGCKNDAVDRKSSATLPSPNPPGGLKPEEVPQFVCLGFDDNSYSGVPGSVADGGMAWALSMLESRKNPDGSPCIASFYCPSKFIDDSMDNLDNDSLLKESWRKAWRTGHEIGLHTHTHPHGANVEWEKDPPVWNNVMNTADWSAEIQINFQFLTKPYTPDLPPSEWGPGITKSDILGFRTPYLEFNNATLKALLENHICYDCSIEEGFQDNQDGTDFYWPYQLDKGSPVADATFTNSFVGREVVGSYPGLWEMPVYCMFAPDDDNCEKYGLEPGFRDSLQKRVDYFNPADGKITGFDWNLWVEFSMTEIEVEAILKYTLDLRLKGNRAPFLIGLHSDIYSDKYIQYNDDDHLIVENYKNSQKAIENIIDYAVGKKEVRIVSLKSLVTWMKNPTPL